MAKKLVVENKCTVDATLPLSYLNILQGNLKTLSDESYKLLKKSILKLGFIFPIFVWEDEDDNKIYVLDGTQRVNTLTRMQSEGYQVPQLPVVLIEATDIQDAKTKLAAAASQYGKFDEEGTREFFKGFDLSDVSFDIPFMDFSLTLEPDEPGKIVDVESHTRELKNTGREVDLNDFKTFQHTCPKCSFEWNDK